MKYTRRNVYRHLKDSLAFPVKPMPVIGILSLLTTGVSLISPYLYKILLDDVMTDGKLRLLGILIPSMLGVYCLRLILSGLKTYVSKKFSYRVTLETKKRLMYKFLSREISEASGQDIGTKSQYLEQDSGAVSAFLSGHIVGFLTSVLIAAVYLVLMLRINCLLGFLSLILLPLTLWFSGVVGNKYNAVNKESYEVKAKTKAYLFDTMQKWREIKSHTLEARFAADYAKRLEPERALNNKWMFYYALRDFLYEIKTAFFLKVLIYFVGGLLILSGELSIGELLMFISFMGSMNAALDSILKSGADFRGQKAVFDRLFRILDSPEPPRGKVFPVGSAITLRNIGFTYGETKTTVFENASCEFTDGEKTLLVGRSGEGKSTLIKLLLGLNKPQSGQLLLGESELSEIDSHSFFTNVGAVMQENLFFNLSIRENLTLIAPDATEAELLSALKMACLADFVEALPQKIDTVIGERGVKLSGGQKQRLAIARLILHKPRIVILDEATSALDSPVESRIFTHLCELFHDKTMLVISHKPLSEFKTDRHLVVENKEIRAI